jgi:hypothetical protein
LPPEPGPRFRCRRLMVPRKPTDHMPSRPVRMLVAPAVVWCLPLNTSAWFPSSCSHTLCKPFRLQPRHSRKA